MSEFKGTKGKWILGDEKYYNGNKAFEVWYGNDGECVAEVVHKIEDAKLISKAPELLEMISELLKELEFHGYRHSTTIYNAQNLIKEATEQT